MAGSRIFNYYDVLGVERGCSAPKIRAAHRHLAVEWHPDVNSSSEALARMKLINVARDTLIDRINRQTFTQAPRQRRAGYTNSESRKTTRNNSSGSSDEPIWCNRPMDDHPDNNYMQDGPWDGDTCLMIIGVSILMIIIGVIFDALSGQGFG